MKTLFGPQLCNTKSTNQKKYVNNSSQENTLTPVRNRPVRKSGDGELVMKPTKIRTELNIEKWPAIWNPAHSKTRSKSDVKPRTLERETTTTDGNKSVSKVMINPIPHLGDLTTEDQRTLYALIKHWEDQGKKDHETMFSIRQVAKLLNKSWGTNVIDSVTGSLERLRGTLLIWTRSYRGKDQRIEDQETVYVNILSKLKIIRRKVDGHITTEAGYFQFDDNILKNLLQNYTKPFLFDVFMDIKGEIALKLYSYVDLMMADKSRFERCTKELFTDLGLNGISYKNPSKRKQNLERALQELQGISLTTGVLKSATIERTKDGKDYKVVFQKVTRHEFGLDETNTTFVETQPEPVVINDYSKKKDPLVEEAVELVRHFHKVFHGVSEHSPQSKETSQALSLVTKLGINCAKHVVEFAKYVAKDTNFLIQTFGGIIQYTSRAHADFEEESRKKSVPPVAGVEVQSSIEICHDRGEARFAVLTEEQIAVRSERVRAEVLKQNPAMVRFVRKEESGIVDKIVRGRVIRELETEPMDILVIAAMPESIRALAIKEAA